MPLNNETKNHAIECAKHLIASLESGDIDSIKGDINQLMQLISSDHEFTLFPEQLTQEVINQLPEQFDYIKQNMYQATNSTISEVEQGLQNLDFLEDKYQALLTDSSTNTASSQEIAESYTKVRKSLQSILVSQSYQDLCGQVINRTNDQVNTLVLVLQSLIEFSLLPEKTSSSALSGQGPALESGKNDSVNQDEIDDLFG